MPQSTIIIADATFFKRTFGLCVVRSSYLKQNIYWKEIENETINVYQQARTKLEKQRVADSRCCFRWQTWC